jgi:hypothetical protein
MNDENCMVYNWRYSYGEIPLTDKESREKHSGRGEGDQNANFRKVRNKDNSWLIDREMQETKNYTGIEGNNTQDHAVQESMGSIVDRSQEHLGTTDKAIIAARRLLLDAAKANMEGKDPPGISSSYYTVRAIEKIIPNELKWEEAFSDELQGASKW